mgnify:FL=1
MDKLKVILVHDGSNESAARLDPDILPEGIEVVGSLKIKGLNARGVHRHKGQSISGEAVLHVGTGESITGSMERRTNDEPAGRAVPLTGLGEIQDRPVSLTRTELEVLRLLAKGRQNKEIADDMFISVNTVKSHVSSILRKLRVRNRAQAVRYVYKCGMWQ